MMQLVFVQTGYSYAAEENRNYSQINLRKIRAYLLSQLSVYIPESSSVSIGYIDK